MIYIKLVGLFMIISSCSLIGISFGVNLRNRYINLKRIINCIKILETEINYLSNPIPDALENVYIKGNKTVSYIFRDIKDNLLKNKENEVSDSFIEVLNENKNNLSFTNDDSETITTLGKVLGSSDKFDQVKHINSILLQIEDQMNDAKNRMHKSEKLYTRLGILTGVLIAIILL